MFEEYLNEIMVIETDSRLTFIGCLIKIKERSLYLDQVTIVDDTAIKIPLEQFLVECASIGTSPSRKSICINRDRIISGTRLKDIIIP